MQLEPPDESSVFSVDWPTVFSFDRLRKAYGSDLERMISLLWEFVDLGTWPASEQLLGEHPELIDEPILLLLDEWIEGARSANDEMSGRRLETHLRVLRRCQEIGVEACFAELSPEEKPHDAARIGSGKNQRGESGRLGRLVLCFLDAHTWTASRRLVDEHPELLEPTAARILEKRIAVAKASNNPGARLLERHLLVLRRCHEIGVEAAFAELRPDHKGLDPPEVRPMPDQAVWAEEQYRQTGNTLFLDIAIAAWEYVLGDLRLETMPPEMQLKLWLTVLNDLAVDYFQRYATSGRVDDLDASISHIETVADAAPNDYAKWRSTLTNLGVALQLRYARLGNISDLDRATSFFESAVAAANPRDLPGCLNNLGAGLRVWSARTGDLGALDRAVEVLRQGVANAVARSPDLRECQTNLGVALSSRYELAGVVDDLDEAIRCFEQAQVDIPTESPDRPGLRANLGRCRLRRHRLSANDTDLDAAIVAYEEALAETPVRAPERSMFAVGLAESLKARYLAQHNAEDLAAALELTEKALAGASQAADLTSLNGAHGELMVVQWYGEGGQADPGPAAEAFRRACRHGVENDLAGALAAAQLWGYWAGDRHDWPQAAEAFGCGQVALEGLFRTQLTRPHQELWLREAGQLPADAAYALAKADDEEAAVVALEAGRALMLSDALKRDRAELEHLRHLGHADLAERYGQAASRFFELQRTDFAPEQARLRLTPTPRH